MAKAKQNSDVLADLTKMAEEYSVADNAMFKAAAKQYAFQQAVISGMRKSLEDEGSLMTTKE